jgi:hypothetical protein
VRAVVLVDQHQAIVAGDEAPEILRREGGHPVDYRLPRLYS